jgi:hypothetical protein
MVKVGEESEPWCQSCKEGAKVCAYERAERAKAIGLPAKTAAVPEARQASTAWRDGQDRRRGALNGAQS